MATSSLGEIFGINATQDSNYLVINKDDLSLNPAANNSPGEILVALVIEPLYVCDDDGCAICTDDGVPISNDMVWSDVSFSQWQSQIVSEGGEFFEQETVLVEVFSETS